MTAFTRFNAHAVATVVMADVGGDVEETEDVVDTEVIIVADEAVAVHVEEVVVVDALRKPESRSGKLGLPEQCLLLISFVPSLF
jgi:hypothetical protein